MPWLGSVWGELTRGNTDAETCSLPLFYVRCKARFRHMRPGDIQSYQTRKARNVVRYAVRHSSFFSDLYRGRDLDDVWSLPPTHKQQMMANLGAYNTLGLTRQEILDFGAHVEATRDYTLRLKGVNIGMSSGTSGSRGVEITTRREESYLRAAFFARFPWPRARLNMAFVLRVSSPAFQLRLLGHRLTYVSQLNKLETICDQLRALNPNVLAAPPSLLRILAHQVEAGKLALAPLQVVSYAEVLYPEDRVYLSDVFRCPVYEIYKATEGAIAISCRQGSLHINEDLVAVELLDEHGHPVQPGTPSHHMLVTDLHKTSQPIIRHALNDVVTIRPHACACGSSFRVIQQVQGRADDTLWGARADGKGLQFVASDYVRRAIAFGSELVEEYQVTQEAPERLTLLLQISDVQAQKQTAAQVSARIERVFRDYGCREPTVEVAFGTPAPSPQTGKLIRIRRAFEVPDLD